MYNWGLQLYSTLCRVRCRRRFSSFFSRSNAGLGSHFFQQLAEPDRIIAESPRRCSAGGKLSDRTSPLPQSLICSFVTSKGRASVSIVDST